jgi:DNA-binding response OmpR family regulator
MLPDIDGIENFANKLKKSEKNYTPIIYCRSEEIDKIIGLETGA